MISLQKYIIGSSTIQKSTYSQLSRCSLSCREPPSLKKKLQFILSLFDFDDTDEFVEDEVQLLFESACDAVASIGDLAYTQRDEDMEIGGNMFLDYLGDSTTTEAIGGERIMEWIQEKPAAKQYLDILEAVPAYESLLGLLDRLVTAFAKYRRIKRRRKPR